MEWFIGTVAIAFTAFTATNIDDILILTVFFAQVDAKFRPRHILIGQYLGFAVIILASLPGYFGSLIIDHKWIGLLGFLPVVIGLKELLKKPEEITVKSCVISTTNQSPLIAPQTYHVAAVTFANSGDNIGIYIPLFASSNVISLSITIATFLLLIAVWCYAAYQFSTHPAIAKFLSQYSNAIVPFVLIALGIYILYESDTYQLLPFFR
ncbi:MAG: cadmium resistance transporter [Pseudanabaena sp.]|jgi:cadmium resistance transport/sequestration family protein|uniref:cadmium resistance transporter n=1 Tax=Pseudanabaena mucicola TaxID=71190 RepID=UPI0025778E19|nr:cadmium resistance transporter [Pseudanabaena mucicola]MCA6572671.1 cadmium resistance transporter [Pseudanabaena sp. M53BS1SP1A06MG]MCA6584224.1 cadmium resistance transporter [Pseudanabaena sp. M34BS1SP1A06MG]MCA6587377.1 cadmium resistance transporter [Pseudanabaena sp. M051S1SP1A06QC]MCA6589225.1 cadmium resistance transporter [Pseudanabaena sp. M109S1SP1A06QC]MCA6591752.1 cadmium resistance transporter [Pseudanabaena sp. M38BS1SP1A06MG]MCA6600704.1 cadmium resistance transporter [Pseu